MENYQKAYAALNVQQKIAADHIEGPLLVIAGPGTGKTQLLSVRVARILKTTDTSPQNILCLTFTNKAATNMRDRLFELIGPAAYSVVVRTFHSFAADIMNEYPDYFWNGARLGSVPDTVQLEIIQDILTHLPLSSPLAKRFAGELTGTKSVQDGLKLVKEAGLTPEKLRTIIAANLAYIDAVEPQVVEACADTLSYKKLPLLLEKIEALPEQPIDALITPLVSLRMVLVTSLQHAALQDEGTGKATHTSKWKSRFVKSVGGVKGMHDERDRNGWWLELAGVYQQYRDKLHTRGYYDYADMLIEVISQLEQNPDLLSDVQERYNYVLVDEFQDTNPAQLRLAHLVADHHSSAGQPNLMVVGDDDQSIFKFNGAELNNMLGFRSFYKIKKPIVLTENYRSSQAILDVAKVIAEQASDRLVNREPDIIKELSARNASLQIGEISHISYPTRQHQLSAVARAVAAQFVAGGNTIAILARSHDSLLKIADLLQSQNVPLQYERQNDALQHEAVKQVLLVANIIVAISDGDEAAVNIGLGQLLQHSMWGVSSQELWELALANRYKPHWLKSLQESKNTQLQKLAANLLNLAREASTAPLPLIIEYLVGLRPAGGFTSPVRQYYFGNASLTSAYMEALSAISLLRDLSEEFAYKTGAVLADFVRFVAINSDNKHLITDESVFMSGPAAVQLLTVHKAKGLEFDIVYIVDANEDTWKPRATGRKPPANLPLQAYGDDLDDYVRLFYVAATRAKHSLHIASFYSDGAGKDVLPAAFARVAATPLRIELADAGDPIAILEQELHWPQLASSEELYLLRPVLQEFSLSATALLNFLDVTVGGPRYFKERNLLRLPEAKTMSQSYGTAIHAALEKAQELTNKDAFDLDDVLTRYEDALEAEHVPPEELERYVPEGQKVLVTLLETFGYALQKGSASEQKLSAALPGGVLLNGKLDRVDAQNQQTLVIADYKTGKPLTSLFTKDQSKAIKAWKHRNQLIFYALLAQQTPRFKQPAIECQMVYVEAADAKDLVRSLTPTPADTDRLALLASKVWQKIQAADFPDTSGYAQDITGIVQFEQDLLDDTV